MAGRKKPLVVITRKLPDQVETRMRELFDARLNVDDQPMSQPEWFDLIKQRLQLFARVSRRRQHVAKLPRFPLPIHDQVVKVPARHHDMH